MNARKTSVADVEFIDLPRIENRAGNITSINNSQEIPFDIERVYYLYDIPGGESRGAHAHKALNQVIVAASGSFTIRIHDGTEYKDFYLNRPYKGLLLKPGLWRELIDFSSGSICLVLASHPYDEADYIRKYQEFIDFKTLMKVISYTKDYRGQWDDFVRNANNGHFMFLRAYMEYHQHKFTDNSLLIFDGNKLCAVFPANRDHEEVISHQGLTIGGLVLNSKSYSNDVLIYFDLLLKHLKSEGVKALTYKVCPTLFNKVARQEDLYALWRNGAIVSRRDMSSVIDLRNDIRYRSTKKQNIKRGVQADLHFSESEDLGSFWGLLEEVLKSKHSAQPTHSLEEINKLKGLFPKNIKCYLVFKGDVLLSGALLFLNNKAVHTQYLAVGETGRELGALDFLLDKLIMEFKEGGYHYFSFGISTEDQGKEINQGLIFQKEGFGARSVMHDFYRIEL